MFKKIVLTLFVISGLIVASGCAQPATTVPTKAAVTVELVKFDHIAAILVVDVFEPPENNSEKTEGACLIFDGLGTYIASGGAMTIFDCPHGVAVLDELKTYIMRTGEWREMTDVITDSVVRTGTVYSHRQRNAGLVVLGVDTNGYTTQAIGDNISIVIGRLDGGFPLLENQTLGSVANTVVNISFGLVPCDQLQGITPESYAEAVGMYYGANPDWFLASGDPLYDFLAEPKTYNNLVLIASAGNIGTMEFPLFPAKLDQVLSVSADVVAQGTPNTYTPDSQGLPTPSPAGGFLIDHNSNPGEVRMDGMYYGTRCHATVPDSPEAPWGTSFAAPKLSYYAAMYLLSGGQSPCTDSLNNVTATPMPVLGYANDDGPWCNLTVQDAALMWCPSLGTVLPPTP